MLKRKIRYMAKRHTNRLDDLESLFLRLEELVLANSGADEFEEVFKLLVAKLWDERYGEGKSFRAYDDERETFRKVSELLRQVERTWPGVLGPSAEVGLRPSHLQVCVQALSKHTIGSANLEVMDGFFEFLVARAAKGAKGQYFTPRHVVEMCVQMLKPKDSETVLDPACGSGGFLIHTLNFVRDSVGSSPENMHEYYSKHIWGFDIDTRAVRVARTLMILAGDGNSNIIRLNSLLTPDAVGLFSVDKTIGSEPTDDTLLTIEDVCRSRLRGHKGFDVILTNPPFAGEVRESQMLESFALSRGRKRVERDVLFLERCVQLLRPGGRMAIVLPHNKLAVDSMSYVREWLMRKVRVLAVVGLGRNTFLPHTHQKAGVLFAQKRIPGDQPKSDEKVFFGISEREGKNSKGQALFHRGVDVTQPAWTRVDHDLAEIVSAFHAFCRSESLLMEV
jgi:type I restriction enzyme M protein